MEYPIKIRIYNILTYDIYEDDIVRIQYEKSVCNKIKIISINRINEEEKIQFYTTLKKFNNIIDILYNNIDIKNNIDITKLSVYNDIISGNYKIYNLDYLSNLILRIDNCGNYIDFVNSDINKLLNSELIYFSLLKKFLIKNNKFKYLRDPEKENIFLS